MSKTIRLSPIASLAEFIGAGELVAFNVGPDGVAYFVIALGTLDYRFENTGGASFAKTVPDRSQSYRVVGLSGSQPVLDVAIQAEKFNIHDIQPLADELLLVCSRSRYKSRDNFEKNGRVYTRDGTLTREILLGDGIQSVQTTAEGVIWTSFFDEGVFGNYGWSNPVGASGLVAWDSAGNKIYEFQPSAGLDSICDCYALNVESADDVWLYYYTQFPLVHLHRREIASFWQMPEKGSDAFAICAGHALFRGGYKDRDVYRLFSLRRTGRVEFVEEITFGDREGNPLVADRVVGRGDAIHFTCDSYLYRVDIPTVRAK